MGLLNAFSGVLAREDDFCRNEWQRSTGAPLEHTRANDLGRAEVCELEHELANRLLHDKILRFDVEMA